MAIELEKLLFSVDTKQLDDALTKIGEISEVVNKLSTATNLLTKAEENNTKTRKNKTKATEDAANAENNLNQAEGNNEKKLSAKEKLLQKTTDKVQLLRDQTIDLANSTFKFDSALTSSQAALAAQLKIIGGGVGDFQLLNTQLKNLNSFANVNPFDKAVDGLESLKRQVRDLNLLDEFKGLGLATEQIKGLSRDIEKIKQAGISANLPQQAVSAEIERVKKETIALANEVNVRNAQAKELERIAKEKARVEAEELAARQNYKNAEESVSREILGTMGQYYKQMESLDREAENARKESFNRMIQIHEWKQQQDEQNYRQEMQNMREYYLAMEKESAMAFAAIKQEQDALAKEQLHGKYIQSGYSSKTANVAAGLELKGVPQDVINSYLQEAKANEEATRAYRDKLTAIRAVQSAEERAQATLDALNSETSEGTKLNERAALAVGSYERYLKQTGISAEEAATKLKTFKDIQAKITEATSRNQMNYLARGIGVQMGDIGVSLASGMNPLLVAVQQGSQIQQLIQMANVGAKDMQKVMGESIRQMVESFKLMGVAVGSFALGGLKAFVGSISEAVGASKAFAAMSFVVAESYGENSKAFNALQSFGKIINTVALGVVAVGAVITASVLVSLVQTANAIDKLNESLVLNGAALGATGKELTNLSMLYGSVAASSNDLKGFYAELAKAGFSSKEQLEQVTESSIKLAKYSSLGLEDIAKSYGELGKDPVKALQKLAEDTGLVNTATIENVRSLKEQNKDLEANKIAIEAMSSAHSQAADRMKSEMSALGALAKELSGFWNAIGTAMERLLNSDSMRNAIVFVSETIAKASAGIMSVGASDEQKANIQFNLKMQLQQLDEVRRGVNSVSDAEAARAKLNSDQATAYSEYSKKYIKENKKELEQVQALSKAKGEYIAEKYAEFQDLAKRAGIVPDLERETSVVKELSKQWDDANKVTKEKNNTDAEAKRLRESFIRDQESLNKIRAEAEGKVELLTKAEMKLLEIQRSQDWSKRNKQQKEILETDKEKAKQAELYANMIKAQVDSLKSWSAVQKELAGQGIELQKRETQAENEVRILGANVFEQKKIRREIELQNKLAQDQAKYEKLKLDIEEEYRKSKEATSKAVVSNEDRAALELQNKTIYENAMKDAEELLSSNRKASQHEVNIAVAADLHKELDRVSDNFADSLIQAMQEGGEAGSKKLGDFLKSELMNAAKMFLSQMIKAQLISVGQSTGILSSTQTTSGTNLLSLGSTANSLINGSSGIGGYASTFGSLTGNSAAQAWGAGFSSGMSGVSGAIEAYNMAAADAIAAGNAASAMEFQAAASSLAEGAAAAEGALGTLSAALPWVGGALAIGSLFGGGGGLFGGGGEDPHNNPDSYAYRYSASRAGIGPTDKYDITKPFYETMGQTSGSGRWGESTILDDKTVKALNASVQSLFDSADKAAEQLGLSADLLDTVTIQVDSEASDLATAYTKSLSDLSDELTKTLLPTIGDYQTSSETLAATLSRLVTEVESTKTVFDVLGHDFKLNGEAAIQFADGMSKVFGGVSNLTSAFDAYYQGYYTDAERFARASEQLATKFSELGYSMPETVGQFRKLVESLDLTTESGQKTASALLGVASSFKSIADAKLKDAMTDVEAAYSTLERSIAAAKATADTLYQNKLNDLEAAYEVLSKSYQDQIDAAQKAQSAIGSLADALNKTVDTIVANTSATLGSRAKAYGSLSTALSYAMSGGNLVNMQESITSAVNELQKPSEQLYSSFADYAFDQAKNTVMIKDLAFYSKSQKSVADLTLETLQNASLDAKSQYEDQKTLLKEQHDDTVGKLDQQLQTAKSQLDALNGINSSVLSVKDALAAFASSLGTAQLLQDKSKNTTYSASGASYYKTTDTWTSVDGTQSATTAQLKETIDQLAYDPFALYYASKSVGISLSDLNKIAGAPVDTAENWAKDHNLPVFAEGGYTGPGGKYEPAGIVHKGEFVFNQEDVINLGGPGELQRIRTEGISSDTTAIELRLEAVVQAVEMLRYEARATATNTSKMAKQLDRTSGENDTLKVQVV